VAFKGYLREVKTNSPVACVRARVFAGAKNITDYRKQVLWKITNAGIKESHAHDIEITREAAEL